MASKTYRPKANNEGLVVAGMIERRIVGYKDADGKSVSLQDADNTAQGLTPVFDRAEGEQFVVGEGGNTWPYTTEVAAEQDFLGGFDAVTDQAKPSKGDS